ncbi:GGDEF domain-containing protein [Thalassotalea profundi]|uniref:diguanylate cyclase n=1 Tax=Thalassotalea profundi TaxID=2036687 RepID=A0ABQ3IXQ7_9GAMM|nr:GGDEF domain-containing protein [Thalassotalea profundi]GHE94832.1 diguanylate cyclase [Thalassotalea profundi]
MKISAVSAKFIAVFILFSTTCVLANTTKNPHELTTINVQLKWYHQFQFAGYYIAKEKGYYKHHGLDVKLIERAPGPSPIEKLSYGDVDYAIGAAGAIVYRANGIPLVALATFFQHSPSLLISRYPKLSDLTNKKVMVTKGLINAEIIAMFRKNNITANSLNVIPSKQALGQFIQGHIDAYNIYSSNEIFTLQQEKLDFYSFTPAEHGIDFYGDVLLTLENKVRNSPEEVKNFTESTKKGWQYAINNIDETIDIIMQKYNSQGKSKEELAFEAKQLIQLMYADIIPLGYMNTERWQFIENELRNTGILKGPPIDLNSFVYSSISNETFLQAIFSFKKQILVIVIVLFISALFFHNRRLKVKIKEHTQLLEHERVQAEKEARTDALTQLANRRKFMESIKHDLSIATRNHLDFSIIYIDIDHFKTINDTYGHAAGDKVLVTLADILKSNTRPSDNVSRIGGEEFAITSLGKNTNTATALADRIRKKVEDHRFVLADIEVKITISLGVATLIDSQTSDELLKRTDDALYKAKNSGRNQVQVA